MTHSQEKADRHQVPPFPLRMKSELREAAMAVARREERSLNWVLNDRLGKAFATEKGV